MALNKEERETIDNIKEAVIELKTVLLGTDGDNGLIGDVKRLGDSHFKLKQRFWILIGILAGSGIGGGVAIDKFLGG